MCLNCCVYCVISSIVQSLPWPFDGYSRNLLTLNVITMLPDVCHCILARASWAQSQLLQSYFSKIHFNVIFMSVPRYPYIGGESSKNSKKAVCINSCRQDAAASCNKSLLLVFLSFWVYPQRVWLKLADDDVLELCVSSIFKDQL
jgi:hypothetical protein